MNNWISYLISLVNKEIDSSQITTIGNKIEFVVANRLEIIVEVNGGDGSYIINFTSELSSLVSKDKKTPISSGIAVKVKEEGIPSATNVLAPNDLSYKIKSTISMIIEKYEDSKMTSLTKLLRKER